MKLDGKTVIVTGAAAHIGEATAVLFARQGAKVVVTTRQNSAGAEAVVNEIKQMGGEALFVQADLSRPDEAEQLMHRAVEHFGSIDVLINNAGYTLSAAFDELSPEQWKAQMDDNFLSTVYCSQAATKIMSKQGQGVILNTASIRGLDYSGRPGALPYCAAKAAVINFTKNLAKELAPNIRVNAVSPGFVLTSNYDVESEAVKKFIDGTLLKRWIQPEEIAEAFLYLASADAVTGENLIVDAGYSIT
jgi:3-oxoacyl-[acyl-carrier protein] reductase